MTLARFAGLMLSVLNVSHTPRRAFAARMETISALDR